MNKRKFFLVVLACFVGLVALAQDLTLYQKHVYIKGNDTLPYRLLLPENYDPSQKYPLIYFLHGAGERGNDNESQLVHGAKLFLKEDVRKKFPAIIVFPQCHSKSFWSNVDMQRDSAGQRSFKFLTEGEPTIAMKLAQELLNEIIKNYPVRKNQIIVAGLSMGGMGTFEIVRRNPKLFAAAIPICGGANPSTAEYLKKTNWWVFHGGKDNVVPPALSDAMVAALKKAKAEVRYTLYPDANHNSWDSAFAEPDFLPWIFAQKR